MHSPGSPLALELRSVTKQFGELCAVRSISLEVGEHEFFSLLGPSGCGKSTLLRMVAGLEYPDSGSVLIKGTDMAQVPAHERPVNTVFQSYALFPHLSVFDNVAFGLKMKRVEAAEIKRRVHEMLELFQIEDLRSRKPAQISGGQSQRVALARAAINQPRILLLDEPLGALDLKLRKELQRELLRLQRELKMCFLYVTHDQEEAIFMSHRIAVMRAGEIEQIGSPQELYEKPRTRFVSHFIGSCNIIEGTAEKGGGARLLVSTPLGAFPLDLPVGLAKKELTFAVRPEKIIIRDAKEGAKGGLSGKIQEAYYLGAETDLVIGVGERVVSAKVMNSTERELRFRAGDQVSVVIPPEALVLLQGD